MSGIILGSVATYFCVDGYALAGNTHRTCENNTWTGTEPICLCKFFCLCILECVANFSWNFNIYCNIHFENITLILTRIIILIIRFLSIAACTTHPRTCTESVLTLWVDGLPVKTYNVRRSMTVWYSMFLLLTGSTLSSAVVACPLLMDPPGGHVDVPSLTQGSIATYSCNEGYIFVGESSRVCDETLMWTGNEPVCQSKCNYILLHNHVKWTEVLFVVFD